MASTNDLKNGLVLNIDGQLWTVVEFQHVKPGKGPAFVRTKLKNILSGKVVDKTFNAGVSVETADVDKRNMQYLYKDGDGWVFMDLQTFEQYTLSDAIVGDGSKYMLENQEGVVAIHNDAPILTPNLGYREIVRALEVSQQPWRPELRLRFRYSLSQIPKLRLTLAMVHI